MQTSPPTPKPQVRVSHLKWEQTQDYNATDEFRFRWSLTLHFDRRMRELSAHTLHVHDYTFGNVTTPERKRAVENALRPWLAPGTAHRRAWQALGAQEALAAAGDATPR
jgi:hypothetical protein